MAIIEFCGEQLLSAALEYQKFGWAVLPLHSVRNGECTCRKSDCSNPGKHPRTKHGVKDASKDPEQIRKWFENHPHSNIGLATGTISGRVVLDVDVKDGKPGIQSLEELQKKNEPLPKTLTSQTPSGGFHYIFKIGNQKIKTKIGFLPGLDFIAEGSYIVAPPSEGKP